MIQDKNWTRPTKDKNTTRSRRRPDKDQTKRHQTTKTTPVPAFRKIGGRKCISACQKLMTDVKSSNPCKFLQLYQQKITLIEPDLLFTGAHRPDAPNTVWAINLTFHWLAGTRKTHSQVTQRLVVHTGFWCVVVGRVCKNERTDIYCFTLEYFPAFGASVMQLENVNGAFAKCISNKTFCLKFLQGQDTTTMSCHKGPFLAQFFLVSNMFTIAKDSILRYISAYKFCCIQQTWYISTKTLSYMAQAGYSTTRMIAKDTCTYLFCF